MAQHRTLFEKVWDRHAVRTQPDGRSLLFIDRHFAHEGSFHAFDRLRRMDRAVARPDRTVAVMDHYAPTGDRDSGGPDPEIRNMMALLRRNADANGIRLFGLDAPEQGIVHVIGPELGLTLPGLTIVCGDSHTSTHGAFGALAFGIGASEVAHVLATQTLWQARPRTMRVTVNGRLSEHVQAKDLILALIALIGAGGAAGHVIEYAGPAIRALSMEGRLTVCNMSIEAGARAGMIAPDDTTLDYIRGRPHAPAGALWDRAAADWRNLASDPEARFDREVALDAAEIAPVVTWGTSPDQALPVTGTVPDPAREPEPSRRAAVADALAYMGLRPGVPLTEVAVDRVFIGSCTNARIEDLRAAAAVLKGRRACVPVMVVPGSTAVKRQAEAEGLDRVFRDAGCAWLESACSMCAGTNGDVGRPGERVASTTNRNFKGRQGPGVRTHLMSPVMAAAAAATGRIADVRVLGEGDG